MGGGGGDRMAGMCPFISQTLIPLLSHKNTLSDNDMRWKEMETRN